MRPLIAVAPLTAGGYRMMRPYLRGIEQAGGAPVVLPLTENREVLDAVLAHCQGLLVTGGQDVDPGRYGQMPLPECGKPDLELDGMEYILLDWAMERDVPILAVCRGIQILNTYFGGTLYQHLPAQCPSSVNHSQEPPYDIPVHSVTVAEDSFLAGLTGAGELQVNSFHHQAVDKVAPGFVVDAVSEDGLVEAIHLPERRFVLGVQWHPEFFLDQEWSRGMFNGFVTACER